VVASIEFEFLAKIRRVSELGFDSIRIRFRRIRISISEFKFEFGELYTLFQNSYSPNIREYEFEFELGEFFPTSVLTIILIFVAYFFACVQFPEIYVPRVS
jgi:hypothetical protein